MINKEDILSILSERLGQGRIKLAEPMAFHTTFQIGGPADFYFEANTREELLVAATAAQDIGLPYFVLGSGSNILFSDKGFRGLVIKNKTRGIKILGVKGKYQKKKDSGSNIQTILVEVDSGVLFNTLVRFTIEEGLSGLEEFIGLPGTVGGAISGSAHWQGKTIDDFVVAKKTQNGLILSATFKFDRQDKEILWQRAQQAIEHRQKTQPSGASAGCIFKNIKKSEAARIGTPNLTTSAGFLIESAGLKGVKVGQVQLSPVHANFIINLGGGKAEDVLKLINLVKEKVFAKFSIKLDLEIIVAGQFS
jgi:UDP-N-acetylmuramate dehydrogenase